MSNILIENGRVTIETGFSSEDTDLDKLQKAFHRLNDCIATIKEMEKQKFIAEEKKKLKKQKEIQSLIGIYTKHSNRIIDTLMRVRDKIPNFIHLYDNKEKYYMISYMSNFGTYVIEEIASGQLPDFPETMALAIRDELNKELHG
jgi:hypothetical protein